MDPDPGIRKAIYLNYGSGRSGSYLNIENNMLNHQFCNLKITNNEHFLRNFSIIKNMKDSHPGGQLIMDPAGYGTLVQGKKKDRHSDLCEAFLVVDSHSCFLSSIPSRSLSPPSAHVANTC